MAAPTTYSFVAGHYTATWNGSNIGTTRDGFGITDTFHVERINIDEYGDAPIDGVQRGVSTSVELDFAEYPLILGALYGQNNGSQGQANNTVGQLIGTLAKPLILTPAGGTGTGSSAWTFTRAIIDNSIRIMLQTKNRQGPVQFTILPVPGAANYTAGS